MRFILALAATAAIAAPAASAPQTAPSIVYFGPDSDQIDAGGRARLNQTARQYNEGGAQHVMVAGHAGSDEGSREYTVGLSQRRASAVREYLVSRGVPAGVISVEAFGQTRPAVETDGSAAANRRVEVTFGPGSGW